MESCIGFKVIFEMRLAWLSLMIVAVGVLLFWRASHVSHPVAPKSRAGGAVVSKDTGSGVDTERGQGESRASSRAPARWDPQPSSEDYLAWRPVDGPMEIPDSLPPDVEAAFVDASDLDVESLSPGMRLAFPIPQESRVYSGQVKETHRRFGNRVAVVTGQLAGERPFASFSIVDDGSIALATVATGQNVYQIEIDRRTGIGTVLDDRQFDRFRRVDDGLLPPQRN